MLLESISSFIYILFMGAGSLNERRGNDSGVCSKVAARSIAGPAQTLRMSLSAHQKKNSVSGERGEFQKPRMLKLY